MSVLVLGGAGYIGSHTVYELVENGEDVVVIDNLQTGHLDAVHCDAKFYQGDIRDKIFLDRVFAIEDIDSVIHFAANSLVGESIQNPLKYYDNNVFGTQVLIEVLIERKIDKIVFSSSAAVYGEPEHVPIAETDKTNPLNPYGETKLAMEKMFKWVSAAHNIKYVSLRYFNACGAHCSGKLRENHNPETHLIPIVLQAASGKRNSVSIYGVNYDTKDGTCVRDYIHVTDLAQAHILALKYLRNGGESNIFNLGCGEGFTVKEVIDSAIRITKQSILVTVTSRRAGDPAKLIASSEKAKKILGWEPKYSSLETIISSAWMSNPNYIL